MIYFVLFFYIIIVLIKSQDEGNCIETNSGYNYWKCYTVLPGDNIYSIADNLGTSPHLICDYNSNYLEDCNHIEPG